MRRIVVSGRINRSPSLLIWNNDAPVTHREGHEVLRAHARGLAGAGFFEFSEGAHRVFGNSVSLRIDLNERSKDIVEHLMAAGQFYRAMVKTQLAEFPLIYVSHDSFGLELETPFERDAFDVNYKRLCNTGVNYIRNTKWREYDFIKEIK